MSSIGSGRLFVCLANNIKAEEIEGLAQGILGWRDEQEPEGEVICVFQDSSFEDNVAKTNLCAILEQAGIKNQEHIAICCIAYTSPIFMFIWLSGIPV